MIRIEGVRFAYIEGAPVLDGVNLTLAAGLTLLLGPNGCGKSTLLRVAAGIERPDSGRVTIEGRDLWKEEVAARQELAYVPEQPDLTPYATVAEILVLAGRLRGEPSAAARRCLETVGLDALGDRSVRELSMGQRRRAALAAAMVGRPRVLLLDEPLESLDRAMRQRVLAWAEEARIRGAAVVVATHETEPYASAAVRAFTVRDGRVRLVDPLPEALPQRAAVLDDLAR